MNTSIGNLLRAFLLALITLSTNTFGQGSCPAIITEGPIVIFDDNIEPGWNTTWSWGNTVPPSQDTVIGKSGSYALKMQITSAGGGGLELHANYGLTPHTYGRGALTFTFRKEMAATISVGIRDPNTNQVRVYAPITEYVTAGVSTVIANGQWYNIAIPLTDLQSVDQYIGGVVFYSNSPGTIYVDNVAITDAFLKFPLAGKTPYDMRVVSVMDNNGKAPGVLAYNGEAGVAAELCYLGDCSILGYKKADGGAFSLPLLNYDQEKPSLGKDYLWYDKHKGYDYAENNIENREVYATAGGSLCVASSVTAPGNGVWRHPSMCLIYNNVTMTSLTYISPTESQWSKYHAAYIIHDNSYSSWYVHLDSATTEGLDPTVRAQIIQNGYAVVTQGQQIGFVGKKGTGAYHLHFGLKKKDGSIVDPYGNGKSGDFNLLWIDRKQP